MLAIFASLYALIVCGAEGAAAENLSSSLSECQVWKNVTDVAKKVDPLNVSCVVYPTCNGFQCSGELSFDQLHENVEFGASFIPCTDPLKFEVIIDIPNYPFNLTLYISKNQKIQRTLPLPGASRKFAVFETEANLTVSLLSSVSSSGIQLITTEVNVTVKIKPGSLKRNFILIPTVTIPFPACFTEPTIMTAPSTAADVVTFELTGETCSHLSMENGCIGDNQMCVLVNNSGKCSCEPLFYWNKESKQCSMNSSANSPLKASAKNPDKWTIIATVITGVIFIAAILILVIYKYRRYRERYGQHALLIDNENDTELDDPDSPMITG